MYKTGFRTQAQHRSEGITVHGCNETTGRNKEVQCMGYILQKKKQFGSFFAFQCRTTCRTKATRQFLCKYKPYCTKPLFMTVLDCHSSSWDHVTTSSVNTYFMTYFLQFQVRYFEKVESQYSPKMKLLKSLILNLSLKIQREIDDF